MSLVKKKTATKMYQSARIQPTTVVEERAEKENNLFKSFVIDVKERKTYLKNETR